VRAGKRGYIVDVEYSIVRDGEDCGGSISAVHFRSQRSQEKFVRALEELCSRNADAMLEEIARGSEEENVSALDEAGRAVLCKLGDHSK
jgi:hypothetical protein